MQDRVILVQEEPRSASQLVELVVTQAGSNRIPFPDVQNLRSLADAGVIIKGMRLITDDVLSNAPTSGVANAPIAELQKMTITFYCEGWEKMFRMPVLLLNDMTVPGGTFPHRYQSTKFNNWQNVDWSKSFIEYANGTGGAANVPYALILDVEYVKLNTSGYEIVGPAV